MNWLSEHQGKVVVIKLGGNAIVDQALLESFAADIAQIVKAGVRVAVVHGGGPQISEALAKAGIPNEFIDGLRVSSKEALPIIRDVLMDQISLPLVALIEDNGVAAKALNGFTEDLLLAELTRPDLGWVGEVFAVRDGYLNQIMGKAGVPVISTVAPSEDGDLINVNADLAAASVATALQAEELIVLTDVDGLYENWPNQNSLVSVISIEKLESLIPSLESGMIPKAQACLTAVFGGVKVARILNGSKEHALANLLESAGNLGTKVVGW